MVSCSFCGDVMRACGSTAFPLWDFAAFSDKSVALLSLPHSCALRDVSSLKKSPVESPKDRVASPNPKAKALRTALWVYGIAPSNS